MVDDSPGLWQALGEIQEFLEARRGRFWAPIPQLFLSGNATVLPEATPTTATPESAGEDGGAVNPDDGVNVVNAVDPVVLYNDTLLQGPFNHVPSVVWRVASLDMGSLVNAIRLMPRVRLFVHKLVGAGLAITPSQATPWCTCITVNRAVQRSPPPSCTDLQFCAKSWWF